MSRNGSILRNIDWGSVAIFLILSLFGWINIYGATYNFEQSNFFDLSGRAGKQFIWIISALVMGSFILFIDSKTFNLIAWILYGLWILILLVTPLLAHDIKGSLSWITLGPIRLQPAEFAKCFTALAVAKYMSRYEYKVRGLKDFIIPFIIIAVPMLIIMVWQRETGSALVFGAFLLVFYRQGMSGYILLIVAVAVTFFIFVIRLGVVALPLGVGSLGILVSMLIILAIEIIFLYVNYLGRSQADHFCRISALVMAAVVTGVFGIALFINIWVKNIPYEWIATGLVGVSVLYLIYLAIRWRLRELVFLILFSLFAVVYCYSCDYAFEHILQPHQRSRIEVLLGLKDDPSGAGYNVNQAKIAIGSGRLTGKGFLQGTQTKLQFVPEQATDFIFCTVGEEWGFLGSSAVLVLYLIFILRLLFVADRQKDRFAQIYGYAVASIFAIHLTINIGMVLGLLPVIGIPLPFFSYGGSSLLGFSLLLFIFLRLDADRVEKM